MEEYHRMKPVLEPSAGGLVQVLGVGRARRWVMIPITEQLRAYADQLSLVPICEIKDKEFGRRMPSLQADGGLIVETHVKRSLEQQGFKFNDDLDNKSESATTALFDALARYSSPLEETVDGKSYEIAERFAFKVFGPDASDVKTLPLDESLAEVIHSTTSSGAPEFVVKKVAFAKDLARAKRILADKVRFPYCMPYRRTQHGEDGPKTRLVWGYPLSMVLIEAQFAVPLIRRFIRSQSPMMFGMYDGAAGGRLSAVENAGVRYAIDFSGFDSRLSVRLINSAFSVLATHFGEFTMDERRSWNVVKRYFLNTPIAMPDGRLYMTRRGVPSGSFFTQLVDSIANFIAVQYAFHRTTKRTVDPDRIFVLGDDCILGFNEYVGLGDLSQKFLELGLRLNKSKTGISRGGEPMAFLGHMWWHGLKFRPIEELAKRAVYPERHSHQTKVNPFSRTQAIALSCTNGWELLQALHRHHDGTGVPLDWILRSKHVDVGAIGRDDLKEAHARVVWHGQVKGDYGGTLYSLSFRGPIS
jgi:hypothetical protein